MTIETDKGTEPRTGAHFTVSLYVRADREQYLSLPLAAKYINFLKALFATADEAGEEEHFTALQLAPKMADEGLPTTRPSIDRYCRALKESGVFDASFRRAGKHKTKRRVWRLRDIGDVQETLKGIIHPQAMKRANPIAASKAIKKDNEEYSKTLEIVVARSEGLFFGFLDRGMLRNPWEVVPDNFMVTPLVFQKETVVIETSTQTNGDSLMNWHDKPVMRAVLSHVIALVEQQMADGKNIKEIENNFFIDLYDIARLMKVSQPTNTAFQASIWASMRRLESTRFDLKVDDPANSKFMQFFNLGNGQNREAHFRFIGHIDVLDDPESRQIPRLLTISLGTHLWHRIRNHPEHKAVYRSHAQMMTKEANGLLQVLYDYLRPVIFRTANGKERIIHKPLYHMGRVLVPTLEYSDLKRKLISGLKQVAKGEHDEWNEHGDDELNVLFCGYYIKIYRNTAPSPELKTRDNLWIHIQRDKYDLIIGDPDKKPATVGHATAGKQKTLQLF